MCILLMVMETCWWGGGWGAQKDNMACLHSCVVGKREIQNAVLRFNTHVVCWKRGFAVLFSSMNGKSDKCPARVTDVP